MHYRHYKDYFTVTGTGTVDTAIKERATITVGVTADSAVMPTVIVASIARGIALVLNIYNLYA